MFGRLRKKHKETPAGVRVDPVFQGARFFLFFLSLVLFFGGLPFILAFALGYKYNVRTMSFVKTGLIYIKTQPEGASVYLNGRLIPEKTPASIEELLPGVYRIALTMEKYYPWKSEVDVEAGKVSRVDKVILFPLKPDLQRLNQEGFDLFRVDAEKGEVYYMDREGRIIYRSDSAGENFEDIASLPEKFGQISGWDISPDRGRLFVYGPHQVSVVSLDSRSNYEYPDSFVNLDYSREKVIRVFWHSDSYHLIAVTNRHVAVVESRALSKPVNLVELDKEPVEVFYDVKRQTLYFSDSAKYADGTPRKNLYKLELSPELYILERLIRKTDE
ncbi:MAG: PEGA domain-containing protein [Candidatus Omnitrophica bacterium]|nr:PEGA domain-containing protein [Candidatus Omnitrophota bacterium]MDD5042210.1 PEGA domain-containing protein [Candidatus Omnitrophota bacterium]MDD5500065.1 PEGA domain-containing protein [Candidatus Omnitrophota bacterium]